MNTTGRVVLMLSMVSVLDAAVASDAMFKQVGMGARFIHGDNVVPARQQPGPATPPADVLQPALVIGSAQSPDPVLERVRALERRGEVRDVVVLESFPVQIRLRASAQTLAELERIPRQGGIH